MASRQEIHLNDVGTVFEVTMYDTDGDVNSLVDLTGYTSLVMLFEKPDGTDISKTAFNKGSDPTNGIVAYATESGDLDQVGQWRMQSRITLPTGTWTSSIIKFKVVDNID